MKIAFYAPMKSPNSTVPSGDRRVARNIIQALELKGHSVAIASEFQAREPNGNSQDQLRLQIAGREIADQIIAGDQKPDIWFTYHLYYKAMDWIGPIVTDALKIPYVAAEVSYAPKRVGGPWDMSHQALAEIIRNADAIFGLNSLDSACVLPIMAEPKRLVPIKPFIEMAPLIDHADARGSILTQHKLDPDLPILVTVAMMRDDAKIKSYEVLGEALKQLGAPWQLVVVGDGAARNKVEGYLGHARVTYLGELPETEIAAVLAASDIFVWPSINEAYGMAMLEAQAMGLLVVAGRTGGVADIIRDQETGLLSEVGNATDFAGKVSRLMKNQAQRNAMSEKAIRIIRVEHSIETAAEILDRTLEELIK